MSRPAWTGEGWLKGAAWIPSPNVGMRPAGEAVSLVVIHNISLPPGEFGGPWVAAFFQNRLPAAAHPYFAGIAEVQVSAHFFIQRDGHVVQFAATAARAWHAGQSAWDGRANCNDFSVGIELEGTDALPYAEAQYAALWRVLGALLRRHPVRAVAGHCHIAPGRKTDPGPAFDWARLAARFPGLALPAEVTGEAG